MQTQELSSFRTIEEFQESINNELENLNQKIDTYSKLIGEKIRKEEKNNDEDFTELKEKLDSNMDSKNNDKKKKTKKSKNKNKNNDWISYEEVYLFNGIGTRGELELYFKFLDRLKNKYQNLQKTKDVIDKLIASGIKKNLGCLGLSKEDGTFDITFVNHPKKQKFAYKSVIMVGCEN